jgi:hypothetical protein
MNKKTKKIIVPIIRYQASKIEITSIGLGFNGKEIQKQGYRRLLKFKDFDGSFWSAAIDGKVYNIRPILFPPCTETWGWINEMYFFNKSKQKIILKKIEPIFVFVGSFARFKEEKIVIEYKDYILQC